MLIDTRSLFRPLHHALVSLLRELEPADWSAPTSAGSWTVHDVALHLLDGGLRRISVDRDEHPPPAPDTAIEGYADLVGYLDALNAGFVAAARRISPRLTVELLDFTSVMLAELMESAELHGNATFPVAWAGQDRSPLWLDIGREYTERWHHQDQIREAVGAAPLDGEVYLRPVIEVSLFAIPAALAAIDRPAGTTIEISTTESGHAWQIVRSATAWEIATARSGVTPAARIAMNRLDLARMLMHRLAESSVDMQTQGDPELLRAVLNARAVMVAVNTIHSPEH